MLLELNSADSLTALAEAAINNVINGVEGKTL